MLDRLVPLLLLATGLTGLTYEVVLGRLLALHLGSSGSSQAVTLATFLGGMALGAVLADGPLRGRVRAMGQPLRAWAALEAFIGVWALLLPLLSGHAFALFAHVGAQLQAGSVTADVAKLVLAAVLVLPLTTAMGATLPVLAASVEQAAAARGVQLVSRYYVLNAAGATLGAGLAGFWLIEQLGLVQPLRLGGVVNLSVAAVAAWAAQRVQPETASACVDTPVADTADDTDRPAEPPARADLDPPRSLLIAALATGFVALSAEVLWTRLVGLVLGSSVYAFSFMLVVSIAGVSLGSAVAAGLIGAGRHPGRVLAFSQGMAALTAAVLLARLDHLPIEVAELRLAIPAKADHYNTYLWQAFAWVGLHLLPAAMALGASFPALLATARDRGAATDRATARILAFNTAGNLLGSLGCGFVLMPMLGLEGAMMLGVILSLAVAVLVLPRPSQPSDLAVIGGTVALAGALLALTPRDGFPLTAGLFRLHHKRADVVRPYLKALRGHLNIVFRHDGKDATISVQTTSDGYMSLRTNGKSDGGTSTDMLTQVYSGYLGLFHRPQATRGFVIGLGTGQTVAAMASVAQMQVHCVELSPAVVDAAPLFGDANLQVWQNPRVQITVADAREVLRTLPDHSLDIIASEPSNPWISGVADLFTTESFARIRQKLRRGGVLVQWLQTYETSDRTVREILCTLQQVFPHVTLYRLTSGDLGLVASDEPLTIDTAQVERLLGDAGVRALFAKLDRADLPDTVDEVLAGQLCGAATVAAFCQGFDAPLHEERPQMEYRAPRDFFAGASAKKTMLRLDRRAGADPQHIGDIALSGWLSQRPLDESRRAALFEHLKAVNHPSDTPLATALTATEGLPEPLRAPLQALPSLDQTPEPRRAEVCERLRRRADWLVQRPHTVLGPASPDPQVQRWAELCRAALPRPK